MSRTGEARITVRGKVLGKALADSLDGIDDLRAITLRIAGANGTAKSTKGVLVLEPLDAGAFHIGDDIELTMLVVQERLPLEEGQFGEQTKITMSVPGREPVEMSGAEFTRRVDRIVGD